MFQLVLSQSISQSFRRGGGAFGACAFYIIIVTLFAFALSPDTLSKHAGAVMCVAMLLASITAMPLLFERDHEDGTLEQYLLWPVALELLMLAKIAGQWIAVTLPILLASPLMAMFAGLEFETALSAMLQLLLASFSMIAVGSIAAALTLGARRGGLLQALITLPLYVPILIFASASSGAGILLFLSAMALVLWPLSCFVCGAILRIVSE
ncbi:MAG: heme exporter protein CcmB [Rickettsiales bacterium]|jgi:heme exporter protein B|nr:heme exporter protein CcmB [Rickettsiales bacterium]